MSKKISNKCLELVKKWEGCRLTAYLDSVGVWTIGYGTTRYANGTKVKKGDRITQAQAEALLKKQIQEHADGIDIYMNSDTLNQNQYDALASFHYNLGKHILRNSMLLAHLKAKRWNEAASLMLQYNKGRINGKLTPIKGLTNRRVAEVALFKTPVKTSTITKVSNTIKTVNWSKKGYYVKKHKAIKGKKTIGLYNDNNLKTKVYTVKKGTTLKVVDLLKKDNGCPVFLVKYNEKRFFATANKEYVKHVD